MILRLKNMMLIISKMNLKEMKMMKVKLIMNLSIKITALNPNSKIIHHRINQIHLQDHPHHWHITHRHHKWERERILKIRIVRSTHQLMLEIKTSCYSSLTLRYPSYKSNLKVIQFRCLSNKDHKQPSVEITQVRK